MTKLDLIDSILEVGAELEEQIIEEDGTIATLEIAHVPNTRLWALLEENTISDVEDWELVAYNPPSLQFFSQIEGCEVWDWTGSEDADHVKQMEAQLTGTDHF